MGLEMLAIDAGILGAAYIYHRWLEYHPYVPPSAPIAKLQLPTIAPGTNIPMFWGTVRIRSPLLAWAGDYNAFDGNNLNPTGASPPGTTFSYQIDMFFNVGIPFDGAGTVRLHSLWAGDLKMNYVPFGGFGGSVGLSSGDEKMTEIDIADNSINARGTTAIGGAVEFLNGKPTQQIVDAGGTARTNTAQVMLNSGLTAAQIPSYRGFASVLLWATGGTSWAIGSSPDIPTFSFEMSSIPIGGPSLSIPGGVDLLGNQLYDANPAQVIIDVLIGKFGKLGLDASTFIDLTSFAAAAATLLAEGHGYSREDPGGRSADQIIAEICQQVDGVLRVDPATGLNSLKLIRADYDPTVLLVITPDNCDSLTNYAAGGWTGLVNKVRVVFNDRANDYNESSAYSINQANAVGQDGRSIEREIQMPGVCTQTLANVIAAREISILSRPLTKCTAVCNRSFAGLLPGDPVKLLWPEYHVSGMVFRVANVTRGTLSDGRVTLDLIQDPFFTWRALSPTTSVGIQSFPPLQ